MSGPAYQKEFKMGKEIELDSSRKGYSVTIKQNRVMTLGLLLLSSACSELTSTSGVRPVIKDCVISGDQAHTLSGAWPALPVPLALSTSGEFDTAETDAFTGAVDIWNTFSQASKGRNFLESKDGSSVASSSTSLSSSVCGRTLITNNTFTSRVVIYKQGTWPYGDEVIALTTFCTSSSSNVTSSSGVSVPRIYMAVMELNYQQFFVSGQKVPDLQSIFVHELGHLLGLDHTCEAGGKKGSNSSLSVPDCSSSDLNAEYSKAVMYPVVSFPDGQHGQVRRYLQDNDMGRMNCLYDVAQ